MVLFQFEEIVIGIFGLQIQMDDLGIQFCQRTDPQHEILHLRRLVLIEVIAEIVVDVGDIRQEVEVQRIEVRQMVFLQIGIDQLIADEPAMGLVCDKIKFIVLQIQFQILIEIHPCFHAVEGKISMGQFEILLLRAHHSVRKIRQTCSGKDDPEVRTGSHQVGDRFGKPGIIRSCSAVLKDDHIETAAFFDMVIDLAEIFPGRIAVIEGAPECGNVSVRQVSLQKSRLPESAVADDADQRAAEMFVKLLIETGTVHDGDLGILFFAGRINKD